MVIGGKRKKFLAPGPPKFQFAPFALLSHNSKFKKKLFNPRKKGNKKRYAELCRIHNSNSTLLLLADVQCQLQIMSSGKDFDGRLLTRARKR